jgi:hypothetical protein
VVIPKGPAAACFGPASNCTSVAPAAGPNVAADPASAVLSTLVGDADAFADNCENLTLSFDVANTGLGTLNDVRITGVTVVSPTGTVILTTFPAAVSPPILGPGAGGTASFDFHTGGLAFGDDLVFQVSITSDEIFPIIKSETFTLTNAESDLQAVASKTWDFETDREGWTVITGTFNRATSGGGAGGSAGYMASSSGLNDRCDQVRSPVIQLTAGSTLSLQNNYEIENFSGGQWWDRANVGIFDGGSRSAVNPNDGRLYNASGAGATCATTGQSGWANVNGSWGASTWSAAALASASHAGKPVQLDIAYGTDSSVNGKGFWFDKVTVTNIELLVADAQDDVCDSGGCTLDAECNDGAYCNGAETCNVASGLCEGGTAPVCGDGLFCNGTETCNEATDRCADGTPPVCNDGAYCNGVETCNEDSDTCLPGTAPITDDGVGCTNDSCNESTDLIVHAPDDGLCSNGLFCDGVETCNAITDCQSGSAPCSGGDICNETADICVAPPAADVHVEAVLTTTLSGAGGFKNGIASVTIYDGNEAVVGAGYTVTGNFSGTFNEPGKTAVTNASGVAEFVTTGSAKKGVVVNFCVSNVTGSLRYDPTDHNSASFACGATPPLTDVHVENIVAGTAGAGGGRKRGTATVTIFGDDNLPQSGYTVSGKFGGSFNESPVAKVTGADGTVSFQTKATLTGTPTATFCVSSVAGVKPYDPGDNKSTAYACPP